jgi:hypothetical protein
MRKMSDIRYVTSSESGKNIYLDLNRNVDGYDYKKHSALIYGSVGLDVIVATEGEETDARNLLSSEDAILFSGAWADYEKDLTSESGAIVFTRTVNGNDEKIIVANGQIALTRDLLVFSDGAVLSNNARTELTKDLSVSASGLGTFWDNSVQSGSPETVVSADSDGSVTAYGLNTAGVSFAPSFEDVSLDLYGSNGVDSVYVTKGTEVIATKLLGGEDIVYFTGNWGDYDKDLTSVSGAIVFSRTVGGEEETVYVSNGQVAFTRDKLVFADGSITTDKVREALTTDPDADTDDLPDWNSGEKTPGLGWEPINFAVRDVNSNSVLAVYAEGTYKFQVTIPSDGFDATTTEIAAWNALASGQKPLATFDVNGQTVTAELSATSGYVLTFNVTLPANIPTGDDMSLVKLEPRGATNMTANGEAVKGEFSLPVSGAVIVDNGDPVFTSLASATVDENSSGLIATVTVNDTVDVDYSLSGVDSALFQINSLGQISVIDGSALNYEEQQSYEFVVTATDQFNNSSDQNFTLTLNDVNDRPVVDEIPVLSAVIGQSFSGSIASYFSDEDTGDSLTFSATGLPTGLTISSAGLVSGTATSSGVTTVTITATDSKGLTVSQAVDISVNNGLVISSVLDGVSELDVRSDIVLNFATTAVVGTGNITIRNVSNTTSKNGFDGENTSHSDIVIDVKSSAVHLSADGASVRIELPGDLDLSNNYSIVVDEGAFVNGSGDKFSAVAQGEIVFSTVTPSSSGQTAKVVDDSSNSLADGAKWFDHQLGNFGAGTYGAEVELKDTEAMLVIGRDTDSTYAITLSEGIYLGYDNFGDDDSIYIDQAYGSTTNIVSVDTISVGSGTGSYDSRLIFASSTGTAAVQLNIEGQDGEVADSFTVAEGGENSFELLLGANAQPVISG